MKVNLYTLDKAPLLTLEVGVVGEAVVVQEHLLGLTPGRGEREALHRVQDLVKHLDVPLTQVLGILLHGKIHHGMHHGKIHHGMHHWKYTMECIMGNTPWNALWEIYNGMHHGKYIMESIM